MDARLKAWLLAFLSGFGLLVLTVLLAGVGALLAVASLAGTTIMNGVQVPLGVLAVAAIGLLLAAFLYGSGVYGHAYVAALWATAPFLPGVAAVAVYVAFFALPWSSPGMPREASLYLGGWAALAAWILSAVPLRGLACVDTAQTYSYGWLVQRTIALAARVNALAATVPQAGICDGATVEASDSTKATGAEPGDRTSLLTAVVERIEAPFRGVHASHGAAVEPPDSATAAGAALERTLALGQANRYLDTLSRELGINLESSTKPEPGANRDPQSGLRYVSATGYLDLWRLVYKCEELLFVLDDDVWAIKEAVYDDLRLTGSTIPNRDGLSAKLKTALAVLDPDAAQRYLEPAVTQAAPAQATQPSHSKASPTETPLQAVLQTAAKAVSQAISLAGRQPPSDDESRRARAVLRDVRQAVNEDRGAQWCGIVRARNRLLRTALLAGLVAFLLLGLAILEHAPERALVGAGAFFLVGALFGLFARLYVEGKSDSASDDYGLFEARLIAVPILSGLAGVAGVFLVAIATPVVGAPVAAASGSAAATPLADIFDLSKYLQGVIWAAVFGLTPELVLKQLQTYTNRMLQGLDNSQASGASSTTTQAAQ